MQRFFAVHRSVRAVVTVLTCLALAILVVPSAFARSSNGAIRVSDAHCHDEGNGYIICYTAEGVATETITPAGNAIYTGNVRSTATVFDPAGNVVVESSSRQHFQRLFKDELLQVLSDQIRTTFTTADGVTCTFTYRAHLANGQIQFEHSETVCS